MEQIICFPKAFGKVEGGKVHYALNAAISGGLEVYYIDWKPSHAYPQTSKYVSHVDRGSASDAAKPGSPVVARISRSGKVPVYFIDGCWYQRISWKDLGTFSRVHPVFMFRKNVFREFVRKANTETIAAMERELELKEGL